MLSIDVWFLKKHGSLKLVERQAATIAQGLCLFLGVFNHIFCVSVM
jgi:hypothetical protein